MAQGLYLPEEQTADWTSLGIRDFFQQAGFRLETYKVSQHLERDMPADRVFLDPGTWKVFGFQYKTLYHNGETHRSPRRTRATSTTGFKGTEFGGSHTTSKKRLNSSTIVPHCESFLKP